VLDEAPDADAGEITDKGYIAQALARTRRADQIQRLYADPPGPGVMVF
jgi:feruloyl-CoA synthase